jgi:cytochrome c5
MRKLPLLLLLALAPLPAIAADGKRVFEERCASCHATGKDNAPKPGDKPAWEARVKNGRDELYGSAFYGKHKMPRRGGSGKSNNEIRAAVDYMLKESGQ